MKNILFCIMAVFCLAGCKTTVADVEVGPYTISVIDENVYHIQDFNSTYPAGETFDAYGNKTHFNNCSDMYLIVGKKEALLVDLSNNIKWADNAAESLRQLVSERIEGKPLTITFTHNHGDHTGMLHAFIDDKEVGYAMPETDFTRLVGRFPDLNYSFINEGYVFDLGGIEVETIEVPGHTDGSVVFNINGRDILLTGDAIGSGHGVWIFNTEAFRKYESAVPHLISWIKDPENDVNIDKLRIYGGHYWQRDWLPELEGKEMGMEYLNDMQELVNEIINGTAAKEPSNLGRPDLDTYFRHGSAIIVWNSAQAEEYRR
ncbi:MAG: MBL fold metallo-hydrolase [Bacteroidales bacterium]|nr:MBL fold metallo-hydrolase [Bacteroidales bacterium]